MRVRGNLWGLRKRGAACAKMGLGTRPRRRRSRRSAPVVRGCAPLTGLTAIPIHLARRVSWGAPGPDRSDNSITSCELLSCRGTGAHTPVAALAIAKRTRVMANTRSAKKAVRKILRRTEVNKNRRTAMRSSIRSVEEAVEKGDQDAARKALSVAEPLIARTGQLGIIHRKTASRKISRLAARVKALD